MDILSGTVEQNFLIMLQERMNRMEDELLRLEKLFFELKSSHYHRLEIQIDIEDENIYQNEIDNILNNVFKFRNKFHPVFAAWNWSVYENKLFMHIIFTTKNAICEHIMKEYIDNESYKYSCFNDLYMFIQFFHYCYHDEDEGDEGYNYEYWHLYYGDLHNIINKELTEEVFTLSKNYSKDIVYQQKLRKWVFNHNNWIDVLRIFL